MGIRGILSKLFSDQSNMYLGKTSDEPIPSDELSYPQMDQSSITKMSERLLKVEDTLKEIIDKNPKDDRTEELKAIIDSLIENVFRNYASEEQLNEKAKDFKPQLNGFIENMSKKRKYSRELATLQAKITSLEELETKLLDIDPSNTNSDNEPVDEITPNDYVPEEFEEMLFNIFKDIGSFIENDLNSILEAKTKKEKLFAKKEEKLVEECKEKFATQFSSLPTDKMSNSEIIAYAKIFKKLGEITDSLIYDIEQIQDDEQEKSREYDDWEQRQPEKMNNIEEFRNRAKSWSNFSALDRTLAAEGEVLALLQIIIEANPEMNTKKYQEKIYNRFLRDLNLRNEFKRKADLLTSPFYERSEEDYYIANPLVYFYCKTIADFINWNEILNKSNRLHYYHWQDDFNNLCSKHIDKLKGTNIAGVITSLLGASAYKECEPISQEYEKSVNQLVLEQLKERYGLQTKQLDIFVSNVFEKLDDNIDSYVER